LSAGGPARAAAVARHLAGAGLAAVDPARRVAEALAAGEPPGRPPRFTAAVALGKAAAAMARCAGAALPPAAPRLLVRPHTSPPLADPAWEELSGGHPVPDAASLAAGERLLAFLAALRPGDRLLALISGGASACLEQPAAGLSLADLVATQRELLGAGLPIGEVNAVRKHLSGVKGGGALRACQARVLALLLSDVPGDDPAVIASGPFAADPSTFAEAARLALRLPLPPAVAAHLAAGARGERPETVKPDDPALGRLEARVLAGPRPVSRAVAEEARRLGFAAEEGPLAGEAAEEAAGLVARGRRLAGPRVVLALGGETAVTLPAGGGSGRGGRNQELALAAARALADGRGSGEEAVLALATDGEDAATGAAGALVDGGSWSALQAAGIDPAAALGRHDSHTALAALAGALVATGPTGTNAADLAVYVRLDAEQPALRSLAGGEGSNAVAWTASRQGDARDGRARVRPQRQDR
jgi:glycerate 2-kinase